MYDIKALEDDAKVNTDTLTPKDVMNAIKRIIEEDLINPQHEESIATLDACNIDTNCADCIIQIAVFGDVVFG